MKRTTAVSVGLFVAWAAHDVEELATMAATSREVFRRLPDALPVPASLRSRGLSQAHVNLAIGLMAAPVALAAVAGVRTEGRSPWFRGAVFAFGAHGLGHLGNSLAMRGYTTGVATTPIIVLPYWLLARRVLGPAPASAARHQGRLAAAALPLTAATHLVAALILREKSLGPGNAD